MDCYSCPAVCTPQAAIILGAALALSCFCGALAAIMVKYRFEAWREKRIQELMTRVK